MKSMTGFGKETIQGEHYQLDAEFKSVNQRFLDIQLRLPKEAGSYEPAIRQLIKKTVQRGRLEGQLSIQAVGQAKKEVHIHWELIDQLLQDVQQHMQKNYPQAQLDIAGNLNQLLKSPDFVEVAERPMDEDEAFGQQLLATVAAALERLESSRLAEGQQLQQILQQHLAAFDAYLQELTSFASVFAKEHRARFESKLTEWLGTQVDEARLLTELAILLEKGDVQEELDRLTIHIEKMRQLLSADKPVGRELDFLIQEMNREVNTIGSKSSAIEIKDKVVQMKTALEKIREQIQNVE